MKQFQCTQYMLFAQGLFTGFISVLGQQYGFLFFSFFFFIMGPNLFHISKKKRKCIFILFIKYALDKHGLYLYIMCIVDIMCKVYDICTVTYILFITDEQNTIHSICMILQYIHNIFILCIYKGAMRFINYLFEECSFFKRNYVCSYLHFESIYNPCYNYGVMNLIRKPNMVKKSDFCKGIPFLKCN